jgi:hypothetical protein
MWPGFCSARCDAMLCHAMRCDAMQCNVAYLALASASAGHAPDSTAPDTSFRAAATSVKLMGCDRARSICNTEPYLTSKPHGPPSQLVPTPYDCPVSLFERVQPRHRWSSSDAAAGDPSALDRQGSKQHQAHQLYCATGSQYMHNSNCNTVLFDSATCTSGI